LKQISVINRNTKEITRWPLAGLRLNFPMALGEADHRLFVGIREPARLAVFDTMSGHLIAALPSAETQMICTMMPSTNVCMYPVGKV
jgi:hypothetical protein